MGDIFDSVTIEKKKKRDLFDDVAVEPQDQAVDLFDEVEEETKKVEPADVFSTLPGAGSAEKPQQPQVDPTTDTPQPGPRPGILDMIKKVGKYAVKTAALPVTGPLLDPSDPSRGVKNIASAALGTVSGMVGSVPAMARLAGADNKAVDLAEEGAVKLKDWASQVAPKDPTLQDQLVQGATSMAAFMVPSVGVARGLSAASKFGPLMVKLAPAIGTGISTVMEAATEQGGVYTDLVANGTPRAEAAKAASRNFAENVLLIGLTNFLGPTGPESRRIIKALKSVGTEGIQEGMQEVFSSIEKGELPDWKQVATAAGIGGILGGAAGAAIGDVADQDGAQDGGGGQGPTTKTDANPPAAPPPALNPQAKEFLAQNYPLLDKATELPNVPRETILKAVEVAEEAKLRGAAPEQANVAALQSVVQDLEAAPQQTAKESKDSGVGLTEKAVKEGGGVFRGMQEGIDPGESYAVFNDPITKTTLMLAKDEATPEAVKAKIEASRKLITRPRDIGTFKLAVKNAAPNMTEEQIDATAELVDARAETWARMTGKPKGEYFETRFKQISKEQAPSEEDLAQGAAAPALSDLVRDSKPESVMENVQNFMGPKYAPGSSFGVVEASVLPMLKNDQVRKAVIQEIPVDVVDILSGNSFTPEDLLGDPSVVLDSLPTDARSSVSAGIKNALSKVGTQLGTALDSSFSTGRDQELLPTLKASDLNLREIVGLASAISRSQDGGLVSVRESGAGSATKLPVSRSDDALKGLELSPADITRLGNWHSKIISERTGEGVIDREGISAGQPLFQDASTAQAGGMNIIQKAPLAVEYRKEGKLTFPGKYISGPADVAFAFSSLKNQVTEHLYIVATKGGKPIGVNLQSIGSIDQSAGYIPELAKFLVNLEADGFYFVHNHPSGDPTPSPDDRLLAKKFDEAARVIGAKYEGGVVINDTKFGWMDPNHRMPTRDIREYGPAVKRGVSVPILKSYAEWSGPKPTETEGITSPDDVYALVKGIQLDDKAIAAVFLNTKNKVMGVVSVPEMRVSALVDMAGKLGSSSIILSMKNNENTRDAVESYSAEFSKVGIPLVDVVATGEGSFKSYRSLGVLESKTPYGDELFQDAYHGSGSVFNKFDFKKIGTGDGNTAFGWGMYFTSDKDVASFYKNRAEGGGKVYKVEIPENSEFIDFNAPISEQPDFIKKIAAETKKVDESFDVLEANGETHFGAPKTGAGLYNLIATNLGGEEAASRFLASKGVAGMKFKNYRGAASTNFLVFDEQMIKIRDLEQGGERGGEAKGSVQFDEDRTAIIKAFGKADVTTIVHELSHVFRRDLYRTLEEASPTHQDELRRDIQDLEEWAGVESGKWSRAAEEKFARGFENYMATGQAPRSSLQRIFSMMADWFKGVYKFVSGSAIDVQLTPEIKRVFDNMLGGSEKVVGGVRARAEVFASPMARPEATRIQPAPIEGKGTKPLNEIVLDVSKAFGQKIRFGKPGPGMGARVGGVYYPGSSALIVRFSGDLDTTAHELAHSLDDRFGIVAEWAQPGMVSPFDSELRQFWKFGSNPRAGADRVQYRRAEGVAEYIRAWLVNPAEAVARAPKFSEYLANRVPKESLKKLTEFSDDIRAFAGATAHEKVMANVQMDVPKSDYLAWLSPESVGDDFKMTFWDKANAILVDDLKAFTKAIEYAKGEKGITELLPAKDPEVLARLYMGIHAKMDNIFENGMTDARGGVVTGGGLDHLFGAFDRSDAKSLEADKRLTTSFMVAQRTLEKAKQLGRDRVSGIGGGIKSDVDVANQLIADIKAQGKIGMVEEGARRYRAWADATLRYMVEKGRLSEESYSEIRKNNEYYVAMQRIMEIAPGEEIVFRPGAGGGLGSVSDPIKQFRGSTRKISDPYATLMENTYRSVREADRNEVLRNFRDLLVGERGMYQGDRQNLQSVGRLAAAGDKNTLSIFVDGKREVWQFEADVYKALKGMVEGGAKLPGVLRIPAQVLRASIVNFPPFAVRNMIRDLQQRVIVSEVGSGLLDSFKKRGPMDIANLKKFGGDQAGHYLKDKVDYMRAMDAAIKDLATDKNSIVAMPSKLAKGYMNTIQYSEMSGRLAEFSRAFEFAKNVKKMDDYNAGLFAASKARGLMDFAVAGSLTRVINQMIPFTSAAVQGMKVSIDAAQRNPKQFATRWALYALVPTLIVRALNNALGDDEEYQQMPNYIRDMFYNFKIAPNTWLRIPKSYEMGVLAAGVERALDATLGNKKAFDQYAESLTRSLMPFSESALFGPFQGVAQAIMNRDQFRQKSIVPQYEEKLALDLRDVSGASRVAQSLQKAIGVDARKIDFLMGELFGYVGTTISKASDIGRKDKRGLGLQDTGLIVSSPAFAARDVQWVMQRAAELGLEQGADAKRIKNLTAAYWKAEGNQGKDDAAKVLVAVASDIRRRWEENMDSQKEIAKKKADIRAQRRRAKRGLQ
ncbi:MAG: hypothetical protein EKK55_17465 [Rhodocyclaceae bacterium]|nr:MAG: hypothetical protein EKK55_17465 [Rhodocyclaceae bacterium]